MTKSTPKTHVEVTGTMSQNDAGIVGKRLATGDLIYRIGLVAAALIAALRWW